MTKPSCSRRKLLRGAIISGAGMVAVAALTGCGETQIVTETKIKEVIKEVEVEKVVTKEVEVEVERVVVQEKVVTKIVEAPPKVKSATISLWMQEWKDGVDAMNAAIDSFQERLPHYKVEMNPIGYGDLLNKFYPAIVAGTSGDVIYTYTNWWYPVDVTRVLHPLTPTLRSRSELRGIFFPRQLEAVSAKDGEFYVLPLINGTQGPAVLVDVASAEEAGVTDLDAAFETWADFEDLASRTMKKEGDKFVKNGLFLHNTTIGYWAESYIKQRGGDFFDPATNTFDWTTPLALEALQFVVDLYRKYTSVESQAEGWPPLIKKASAIGTAGLWMYSSYAGTDPDLKVEPFAVPTFPGASETMYHISQTGSLSVPKFVEGAKLDAAYEFMRHMWQPENLAGFGKFYSGAHSVRGVYEEPAYLESKFGWVSAKMMPTKVWPNVTYDPYHVSELENNFVGKMITDVADTGSQTVEEMARELTDSVNVLEKEAVDRIEAGG